MLQNYTSSELQLAQSHDSAIGKILTWKGEGTRPYGPEVTSASPETRHYWNYWNSLEVHQKVLYKRTYLPSSEPGPLQLVVPYCLRKQVTDRMHNSVFGGHLGIRKTVEKILQNHYWYNLRDDVKVWVRQCDICAANKPPSRKPKGTLGDMRTGAPFDRLGIDIMGPLPLSYKGNQYIQVITDTFTKWVEILPVPDQTAHTSAKHLVDEVISRFGCPLDLHSDQGRNYESRLLKEVCDLLEIRKTRTTPRHPQCNGQTERFNRTLIQMIKAFIKDDQRDWDQHLGCLAAAYRSSQHETTGFTPNFLMLGREVRLPGELAVSNPNSTPESQANYVDTLRRKLARSHEVVRQHLKTYLVTQKDRYDTKAHQYDYKQGDLVWYRNEQRHEGVCPKLQPIFKGPYVVLQKINNLDFLIQKTKQGKTTIVHHNNLKPYEGTTKPRWAKSAAQKHAVKQQKQ